MLAWNQIAAKRSEFFLMSKIYFSLQWVFHTRASWWFLTEVWVTASLLKFSGLFLVFWPISTMQQFGWAPLVLLFPSPPVPVLILTYHYHSHVSQFFQLSGNLSFRFLSVLSSGQPERQCPLFGRFSVISFWLTITWSRLCDLFVSQNPWELCASHFPRRILGCVYSISSCGQI